jgi:hypothetical protein
MHYLDDILCCPNLIVTFFLLESIKEQYGLDPEFKDALLNCKEGRSWNKFVLNDGFCLELTAYAFQLVLFVCC